MKPTYFSRRSFLRAAGLSPAFVPLLEAERAMGQPATGGPKRMVIVSWTGGHRRGDYYPVMGASGADTDWRLPMPGEGDGMVPFQQPVLEPVVTKFRNDMLMLAGLDLQCFLDSKTKNNTTGTPHAAGGHESMLTLLTGQPCVRYDADKYLGSSGGPSLDQVVGQKVAEKFNLPFPTLTVGGRTGSGYQSTISVTKRDDNEGVTPENSPSRLFKTLFTGRALPGATFDRTLAARKSILDYVGKDLERWSQRFGGFDKQRIDSHLTAVRQIEKQLEAKPAVAGCMQPAMPAADFKGADKFPDLIKAQFDLIAAALRCDLTRSVTFLMTNSGGNDVFFPWLGKEFTEPSDIGGGGNYPDRHLHEIVHDEFHGHDWARRHNLVGRWFFEQIAYFLGLMKDTPEGTGTMLDSSAVVAMNTMAMNHEVRCLSPIVFGSCGGYFKTGGRVLRYGGFANAKTKYFWGSGERSNERLFPDLIRNGVPHNGLLVALSNAMDVPCQTFGDPDYGGELKGVRG